MSKYQREKTQRYREKYPENLERNRVRSKRFRANLRPIVYVWMAPDGQADYVGRGTSQRAASHRTGIRRAAWWTPQHTLLTMTCDSEWQAMEYEGIWGAHYLPRHNKEGYRHAKS